MSKSRQNSNVANRFSVADRAELLTKTGTSEGETVLQRDIGLLYAWTNTQGTDNGGTIINVGSGSWLAQYDGAINVKWFGAKGDGVTDDTVAIQNTFDSFSNVDVYLPGGVYKTTDTLIIRNNGVSVIGAGVNASKIYLYSGTLDGIEIRNDNWANAIFINQTNIKDLSIYKVSASITDGKGIKETLGSGTIIENVNIYDFPYGYLKQGCVNSVSNRLRILAGVINTNTVLYSYGLKITSVTLADLSNYVGFTHHFNQLFVTSTSNSMDYGVVFEDCDVVQISDSYIGDQELALVNFQQRSGITTSSVTAVTFENTYFDGVNPTSDRDGITMFPMANYNVSTVMFKDCIYGQLKKGFQITHAGISNIIIEGTAINIKDQFLYAESTDSIKVALTGKNLNTSAIGVAVLNFNACKVIDVSGSYEAISGTDLVYVQGITGVLNAHDINRDNASSANILNTTAATITKIINMSHRQSFTPSLSFGGASTGITYTSRAGYFVVNNGIVEFNIYIALSSKGTSTGTAKVSIPFAPLGPALGQNAIASVGGTSGTETSNQIFGSIVSDGITIKYGNGAGYTTMVDTNLTNTSVIIMSGKYFL